MIWGKKDVLLHTKSLMAQSRWHKDKKSPVIMDKGQSHSEILYNKEQTYKELIPQIESLVEGESNWIGVLANVSAALRMSQGERFFWVGFYFVSGGELLLGPFQGTTACYRIGYGRGVCGTAWQRGTTVIVDDVELFPGHIACSSESRSEIVVPMRNTDGEITAVLDIDSKAPAAFDKTDKKYLEQICSVLSGLNISKI